jgi:hypothetical protein
MMAKGYPNDVIEQAQAVLEGWKQISPPLPVGEITPQVLEDNLQALTLTQTQMTALETQLTDLRNRRDTLQTTIWDQVKRVRAGVKANFGDDSSQYEMVGGTRLSERKTPTRKAK